MLSLGNIFQCNYAIQSKHLFFSRLFFNVFIKIILLYLTCSISGPILTEHSLHLRSHSMSVHTSCNLKVLQICCISSVPEQNRDSSSFLQPHSISCTHGVVMVRCQINTMDNIYKGKMIAVVYLEKAVYKAHDINSAFSMRKFKSKLAQNNEQERGEERKRRRVWRQDIRPNGNQRTTVKCQSYYRFMLHLLPWAEPHIGLAEQNKSREKKKKKSCHGSVGARQLGKKTERWSVEPEEKAARSAGSYLVWVQWEEGWEEVGGPYICPPHAGLQWVGCTLHYSALHVSSGNRSGVGKDSCGGWWCWVVYPGEEFPVADLRADAHDGHKSRCRQRSLNNQSFWEVDAKWRCGIKKNKKVPGITSTLWPSGSISVDLLTEQIQWLSCHPVFSAPPPAYSCCSIATACWERCTTPPTVGLTLPDTHDS